MKEVKRLLIWRTADSNEIKQLFKRRDVASSVVILTIHNGAASPSVAGGEWPWTSTAALHQLSDLDW